MVYLFSWRVKPVADEQAFLYKFSRGNFYLLVCNKKNQFKSFFVNSLCLRPGMLDFEQGDLSRKKPTANGENYWRVRVDRETCREIAGAHRFRA